MKIFSREFWGTVLIWFGVVIFLAVIYDAVRPVFPRESPYPFIRSIQAFLRGESARKPEVTATVKTEHPPRRPPLFRGDETPGGLLTTATYQPPAEHRQWVWEIKPGSKTGKTVSVEIAHAAPGQSGGFSILAYADTDGDGFPDRKVAESAFLTAEKSGQWSTFTFTSGEKTLFVGNSWPEGANTVIFRGNGLWPLAEPLLEGRFYYAVAGADSRSAGPAFTNLRVHFSD